MSSRKHNKSQKTTLSILLFDHNTLIHWKEMLDSQLSEIDGLIIDSSCSRVNSGDGRICVKGKKVCFGYQLVAYFKFGRKALEKVPPNKTKYCLTISHLCGTRNCCNPDHIILEPKYINDERTGCHQAIFKSALKRVKDLKYKKRAAVKLAVDGFIDNYYCDHNPSCCTKMKEPFVNNE